MIGPIVRPMATIPSTIVRPRVASSPRLSGTRRHNTTAARATTASSHGKGARKVKGASQLGKAQGSFPMSHSGRSPNWPVIRRQPLTGLRTPASASRNQWTMLPVLLGVENTRSSRGGSQRTAPMPAAGRTNRRSVDRIELRSASTSQTAPHSSSGTAMGTKPTWVWARNDATTTDHGRAHPSPHIIDQVRKIISPSGSTVM
jgi:hypothetical protein